MIAVLRYALPLAALLCLGACQKSYTAYALSSTGTIISFDTAKPGTISSSVAVSGLASGVSLVQLGYRPADNTLYGITSDNELATVAPATGVATVVSTSAFSSNTLSGASISFDPVQDQLRVISTEYNLRVNSDGSLADSATKLAFDSSDSSSGKTPQIAAIAYGDPAAGTSTTTLYALDVTTHSLLRVGSADTGSTSSVDAGLLHTIGSTGVAFTTDAGLSLRSGESTAYAVLQQSGSAAVLYTIDLAGGAASEVGTIGSGDQTLISLALVLGN